MIPSLLLLGYPRSRLRCEVMAPFTLGVRYSVTSEQRIGTIKHMGSDPCNTGNASRWFSGLVCVRTNYILLACVVF